MTSQGFPGDLGRGCEIIYKPMTSNCPATYGQVRLGVMGSSVCACVCVCVCVCARACVCVSLLATENLFSLQTEILHV